MVRVPVWRNETLGMTGKEWVSPKKNLMVQHLLCEYETLSLNPNPIKQNQKKDLMMYAYMVVSCFVQP